MKKASPELLESFQRIQDKLEQDISAYHPARKQDIITQDKILVRLRDTLKDLRSHLETEAHQHNIELSILCRGIYVVAHENDELRLLLSSFLFDCCKALYFWNETLTFARKLSERHTAFAYNLLLNTEYLGFTNKASFSADNYISLVRSPLKHWYQKIYAAYDPGDIHIQHNVKAKKVALLLRLWRDPLTYTPALEALDYAYLLKRELGYDAVLFNTNLLYDKMPFPFWPPGHFFPQPVASEETIIYKDTPFSLFHSRGPVWNAESSDFFWSRLQKLNPSLAISFGDCNIFADKLANYVPTATLHYTTDVPIQISTQAALQKDLPDLSRNCEIMLDPSCKRFMISSSATSTLVTENYTRRQFDIPEEAFVFVIIGARLRSEVSLDFLQRLDVIRDNCPNAWFIFVGFYDQAEQHIASLPSLRQRTTYIPFIKDIRGFMALANAMLNPDRAGGGNAAAQSMAEGKPVITRSHGDVALIVGMDAVCKNNDEYIKRAIQIATKSDSYKVESDKTFKRYQALIDRHANLNAILEALTTLT